MDSLLAVNSKSPNLHNIRLSASQVRATTSSLPESIHPISLPLSLFCLCCSHSFSLCAFSITFREMRNEGDVVCLSGPLFREEKVCEIAVKEEEEEEEAAR